MRHDTQIIESFLRGHNRAYGTTFRLSEIPDLGGRQSGIDALAHDACGQSWAIEHTLLEPFVGEQEDTSKFLKVLAPLQEDASLELPGWQFDLSLLVGSIPRGLSWNDVGSAIRVWFLANRHAIPAGNSVFQVSGLPVAIDVWVERAPSDQPRVLVSRRGLPETRDLVVQRALSRKLSKLINTPAGQHVLMFEKADLYTGYVGITMAVDALLANFPQLSSLDRIWVAQSSFAETDDTVFFLSVWPGGVTAKFKSDWGITRLAA
jgi:hypothetical protein